MGQGELDEGVVDTPIDIGNVQPSYSQGSLAMSSQLNDSSKLCLMLCYSRVCRQKCFLKVRIEIVISTHVPQPPVLQDS